MYFPTPVHGILHDTQSPHTHTRTHTHTYIWNIITSLYISWHAVDEIWWSHQIWSHERHGFSNHRQLSRLFNMFRLTTIKHQSHVLLALWEGNLPVAGRFPSQRVRNTQSFFLCHDVSMCYPINTWNRHDDVPLFLININWGNKLLLDYPKSLLGPMLTWHI